MTAERRLHPASRAVILGLLLVAGGLVFQQIASLAIATLITILMAIPLEALANYLNRYRIPRAIGALIGILIGAAVLTGVLMLVIPPLVEQTDMLISQIPEVVDSLEGQIDGITGDSTGSAAMSVQSFFEGIISDPGQLAGPVASIGLSIASGLGAIVLIVVTAFYMAVRPEPLTSGLLALVPPDRRGWAREVMARLRRAWVGWMQGVGVDMLLTGVLVYVGLLLIGLDYAIVFAVFSAVLVIIPYFGAILGAIPPILIGLADSPEKALLALGVYVVVQQIESNATIPLVMADRVKLHPAVVAIGVVVVGQLFGFVGLIVAVPILSAAVILVDELWVKRTEAERGISTVSDPLPGELALADAAQSPPGSAPLRGDGEPGVVLPPGTTPRRSPSTTD
ncbi:AI-2E family transporter [Thermoleophilia bacterium SCSIO 60948]|nr:AI-2E family transporter [Thermoleophilia bacterium SCSIO 60948]